MQYPDVMIDLETTGTCPDRHAIIQIAAIKFNLAEQTVSPDMFKMSLKIPPHRSWDEGTRTWWGNQDQSIIQNIFNEALDWRTVIKAFFDWSSPITHLRFWSKPTTFDFMFLSSYFRDAEMPQMYSYREANDMNTFLRALYFPNKVPEVNVPKNEGAHDALNDCAWQLELLFEHMKNVGRYVPTSN